MSHPPIATLTVTFPDGQTRGVPLVDGQSCRVGRHEAADVRLDDPSVSRLHALLSASSSGVVLSDLSSTNGTFVNGKRIDTPVDLQPNDVVDVGPFKLQASVYGAEVANSKSSGRTMTAQLRPSTVVTAVTKVEGMREMMNNLPPEDVQVMRQRWIDLVTKVVEQCAGKIDKILDDSILVTWYGFDGKKLAGQAVDFSKSITTEVNKLAEKEWIHQVKTPWRSYTGAHSGLALMGSVGGKDGMRKFAVLGDTLNMTFKVVQAASRAGLSCVLTDAVASNIDASINVRKLMTLASDSGGDSVTLFEV